MNIITLTQTTHARTHTRSFCLLPRLARRWKAALFRDVLNAIILRAGSIVSRVLRQPFAIISGRITQSPLVTTQRVPRDKSNAEESRPSITDRMETEGHNVLFVSERLQSGRVQKYDIGCLIIEKTGSASWNKVTKFYVPVWQTSLNFSPDFRVWCPSWNKILRRTTTQLHWSIKKEPIFCHMNQIVSSVRYIFR